MKTLTAALAASTLLAAAPAAAMPHKDGGFQPSSFSQAADAFHSVDLNDDNSLSRYEYWAMRTNTINNRWARDYRGDKVDTMNALIDRSFAELDTDRNGKISQTEFTLGATQAQGSDYRAVSGEPVWADPVLYWSPDYFTVGYYMLSNRLDASELKGDAVYNLEGERIGTIAEIIQSEDRDDKGKYYAMIDIKGDVIATPGRNPRDMVGVPLSDILLHDSEHALVLSTRGEEFLRTGNAQVVSDFHRVDHIAAL